MRRRRLIDLASSVALGLAGCLTRLPGGDETPTPSPAANASVAGVSLPVPAGQLHDSVPRDAIPAIVDPAFGEDWSGIEFEYRDITGSTRTVRPRLRDDDRVIGVTNAGEARAYPLRVLNWHEVVNDDFGGPRLVTYCPLCRSGMVADRRVAGQETRFGVSGELWRSNLVLYDALTDSRWSQVAATAIRGPMTGERLELVPSSITTLAGWRERHRETLVLRPPPASNTVKGRSAVRNYERDPYAGYDDRQAIGPGSTFDDDRLHPKALVIGIVATGEAKAYPLAAVGDAGVINDRVGDRPVVVSVAPGEELVAYDRRLGGQTLAFERADRRHLRAGGSRFLVATGRAVDGPFEGRRLEPAADLPPMFWFSWLDFHPDTQLYQ